MILASVKLISASSEDCTGSHGRERRPLIGQIVAWIGDGTAFSPFSQLSPSHPAAWICWKRNSQISDRTATPHHQHDLQFLTKLSASNGSFNIPS